jgi:hypothetical protein
MVSGASSTITASLRGGGEKRWKGTIGKQQERKQKQKGYKTCMCQHTEHTYTTHGPTPLIIVHSALQAVDDKTEREDILE